MKKKILLAILLLIYSTPNALSSDYIEAVKTFGYISGEGLACGAKKYPKYEHIARAYLVSAAKSDEEQADGMYKYNAEKASAYIKNRRNGGLKCNEINVRFDKQKIFQTKVYQNGKLKMPDGKIIIPRKEYDASLVYNHNENEREKLDNLYNKLQAKQKIQAKKQGIYNKIKEYDKRNKRY